MNRDLQLVRSVLHPTDFSASSERAFEHALAIALKRETRFALAHVARSHPDHAIWMSFPGVRSTLSRWGLLEDGSPRSAVFRELRVEVEKVAIRERDSTRGIVSYLQDHPADLLVLATEGRDGVAQWLRPSVAERTARRTKTMTLFVPEGVEGFVASADGSSRLGQILVPIDHTPSPRAALEMASRAAHSFGDEEVRITLLHCGANRPHVDVREDEVCRWLAVDGDGDAVSAIVDTASGLGADLIVMATAGHEGVLDALRGSTTEQVVRRAPCPVLAVPAA